MLSKHSLSTSHLDQTPWIRHSVYNEYIPGFPHSISRQRTPFLIRGLTTLKNKFIYWGLFVQAICKILVYTLQFPSIFILNKDIHLFILFYLWVFYLHVCRCSSCMPDAQRGQKRDWDALELHWQMAVNHHVGSEN